MNRRSVFQVSLHEHIIVGLRKDIGKDEPDAHKEGIYCPRIPCFYEENIMPDLRDSDRSFDARDVSSSTSVMSRGSPDFSHI